MLDTTNMQLKKLEDSDTADLKHFNANWDKLDAAVGPHVAATNGGHVPYVAATGPANTYAVTLDPVPGAYYDGMALCVKINIASNAASTINVNGLGPIPIKDSLGNNVTDFKANTPYTLRYVGGNFIVQGKGGGGNATAGDLLSGKTATTDSGPIVGTLALTGDAAVGNVLSGKTFYGTDAKTKLTGTMANRAGDNAAIGSAVVGTTLKLTAPAGYFDGVDDKVTITDPDFVAGNIRSGVDLLGVVGTLIEGKRSQSGAVNTAGDYTFTVGALPFTPSVILAWKTADPLGKRIIYQGALTTASSFYTGDSFHKRDFSSFNGYVNATGFKLYGYDITGATAGVGITWLAIE